MCTQFGYENEQNHAFFPLLPLLMNALYYTGELSAFFFCIAGQLIRLQCCCQLLCLYQRGLFF